MDVEIPVLTGNLIVPTQSGFSLNRISKKVRLCRNHFLHLIDNIIITLRIVLQFGIITTCETCI